MTTAAETYIRERIAACAPISISEVESLTGLTGGTCRQYIQSVCDATWVVRKRGGGPGPRRHVAGNGIVISSKPLPKRETVVVQKPVKATRTPTNRKPREAAQAYAEALPLEAEP